LGVESKEKQRWLSRVKILQKLRKSDKIVQKELILVVKAKKVLEFF